MGIYAERDHKAEGDSGWITGAIQLRRIYDALHVYFLFFFLLNVVLMNWLEDSCNFSHLSLILNTSELSTICVLRSHPTTILSSFMTSTRRRFKNI